MIYKIGLRKNKQTRLYNIESEVPIPLQTIVDTVLEQEPATKPFILVPKEHTLADNFKYPDPKLSLTRA